MSAGDAQVETSERTAWLPVGTWIREANAASITGDLVAGFTLAAYVLPAGLGDASLANLPAQAGLYACLMSALVFWLFCSSRRTAVTVTSAISLLVGTSLGQLADGDAARFWALASCTALLVGVFSLITWITNAGVIVSFVSESVLLGFKCGIAFVLASTQLPKLFGFGAGHGGFWHNAHHFFAHLGDTNGTALMIGGSALGVLVLGKLFVPRKPVALVVVVLGIAASSLLGLGDRGVKMLGEVPQGFPTIGLPAVQWDDLNELLPLALSCFMLGAVETVAIGRMFASKHRQRFDANNEFLALSAANLASGLGQGFPVAGGMSQSLVNESAGAKTPLSGLFSAIIILLVVLFFTSLLKNLPAPVLAAVILVAVTGLVQRAQLKRVRDFSKEEYLVCVVAFVGVLASGVLRGVLVGAALSLALLIRRASRPYVTELGRIPGTDNFGDRERDPEFLQEPGVLACRVEGGICYFNVEHTKDRILHLLSRCREPRLAVIQMATVPAVDLAGAEMLLELRHELSDRGIELALVEARGRVRDTLRRAGFEMPDGTASRQRSVALAIAARSPQKG